MTIEDRLQLAEFVHDLQGMLSDLVNSPANIVMLRLSDSDRSDLSDEFFDFGQNPFGLAPDLEPLLRQSLVEAAPHFDSLVEALRPDSADVELDSVLERYGLAGTQLQLKLRGFDFVQEFPPLPSREALSRTSDQSMESRRRSQLRRWLRRAGAALRRSLNFANTILGSLAAAGLAGADPIKELKECFEHSFPAEI